MSMHSFHIPVMGSAFTIDSPIKVARFGISSVISLVDDALCEEMRKIYTAKIGEPYTPITKYDTDFRARRITEYLNLVDRIVKDQVTQLKNSAFDIGSEITKYFELLADDNPLKSVYNLMQKVDDPTQKSSLQDQLREHIVPGDINVNIMTKLDRDLYTKSGEKLDAKFSDALSALRGYGESKLKSAIVFSAGINRRLYSYVEEFKDFYADASGHIKKQIILKVSDYRSAITQGKFFAKKGLWVSEYRIESGLNCGGHAFATTGYLLGPILEEFKKHRTELALQLNEMVNKACAAKNLVTPAKPLTLKITAQGGIGNGQEDRYLLDHYGIDGTGWGTPFLLCPEATNVDLITLEQLKSAKEDDLYLSAVSPLGVPFNNLRNSLADQARDERVAKNRAGSACPKGHLVSNTEFTKVPICTASRQYQKLKLEQLASEHLTPEILKAKSDKVVLKSCICNDLGEAVLLNHGVPSNAPRFPAICPGPNLAYYSKVATLQEMADHIYGRINLVSREDRPHMFIKELYCYVDYLKREISETEVADDKQKEYFAEFQSNLISGINYYQSLFPAMTTLDSNIKAHSLSELKRISDELTALTVSHVNYFPKKNSEDS